MTRGYFPRNPLLALRAIIGSATSISARRLKRRTRRGFIYFIVLGTTAILSIIAMVAIMVARLELRSATGGSDFHEARQLALAGIENGIAELNDNVNWRIDLSNNVEYPSVSGTALGNGTFSWKLVDEDGNLANQINDAVRIYGIGRAGDAIYVESTMLRPTGNSLACLESSLHAGGNLDLDFGTVSSNQRISTNANSSSANGATVNANVEATGAITGSTYNGLNVTGIPARDVPDKNSILEFYLNEGTHIDVNTLTIAINDRILEECVLSPNNNPFGDNATNAQGIYVIACLGKHLKIRNCRIVGTLVIHGAGSGSMIDGSVSWEPAVAYYPSLLVQGNMAIHFEQNALVESDWGVNFNPAGTPSPYLEGSGANLDSDTSDEYLSKIAGLVYVSGKLEIAAGAPTFDGCVVTGGDFDLESAAPTFKYRSTFLNFPPPGFTAGDVMAISPGSWRRDPPE